MGTTTNNGWPTPVATDLVKDGWEAIKDLGDAIDTTLGVYAPSTPGLTLINTTSFSGVASQSVNDVFSADYDNYMIAFNITPNSSLTITMRMRVGGTDNSTTNYHYARQSIFSNGTSAITNGESQTSFDVSGTGVTRVNSNMFIQNPFLTDYTTFVTNNVTRAASTPFTAIRPFAGLFNATTSFTGFTVIASTSNITGSISVYGVNK
jgi:hypothetical protein